jgi:hypothetical protein
MYVIDQFAEAVTKELRRRMNNLADELASGHANNMEAYRFTCGVIRGLADAEEYVKELAKKAEESDE